MGSVDQQYDGSWEDAYLNPRTGRFETSEVPQLIREAYRGSYVDWSEHNIRFRARHDMCCTGILNPAVQYGQHHRYQ